MSARDEPQLQEGPVALAWSAPGNNQVTDAAVGREEVGGQSDQTIDHSVQSDPANGSSGSPPAAKPQNALSASLSKRRAAKRESARRVRAKNKDLLSSLSQESHELETSNGTLAQDIAMTEAELYKLREQVAACRTQAVYTRSLTDQLSQELIMLQRMGAGLRHQREMFTSSMSLEHLES